MNPSWSDVDAYLESRLVPSDPELGRLLAANAAASLPAHDVAPNQGKLLYLLARMMGARRVLEIGTLGAYSTIWLARALPPGGRVVTLEANPAHARVAEANLVATGFAEMVELHVGPALESLPSLLGQAPFDLVFIDADKPNNPSYLEWALRLSRPGTVIVADNVVRHGAVANADSEDPNVQGIRRFFDRIAAAPRLCATALQTVGSKGWDGFAIAIVDADRAQR